MKERRYDLYGDRQMVNGYTTITFLSIPFIHLILKNFFLKEKYREIKLIVKIIWQSRCNLIIEWKRTKGIKKQDLKKKILAHQRITYERIPTQQIEGTSKKF
ncbi:hypothetical protein RIR_jg35442.t1 [Rhizophagus irregularis DAOM 181602=DAOM 197198]|nr:hypothetical protein RIR_jg35442.t1 [Rhizophagus irregularis DAOM 181602=DAOM 197198]